MDLESHRDLRVLEAVAADGRTSQRRLAEQLGIALGLANLYLKRLARKGYIKCVNVQRNRLRYLITPTGIAEKTRLTYEFMEYSLRLFRESRTHLRATLARCAADRSTRIAIFGTGEAAELTYLCLKELGAEPVAVFDGDGGGDFLGIPVQAICEQAAVNYDRIVVATMADPETMIDVLMRHGVGRRRMILLRSRK